MQKPGLVIPATYSGKGLLVWLCSRGVKKLCMLSNDSFWNHKDSSMPSLHMQSTLHNVTSFSRSLCLIFILNILQIPFYYPGHFINVIFCHSWMTKLLCQWRCDSSEGYLVHVLHININVRKLFCQGQVFVLEWTQLLERGEGKTVL